tara:strand:- start:229 stop:618 length:390 start_codon:yes stop_codon:yes gene_type:complete
MKTILVDAVNCFVSERGEINTALYQLLESFDNPKIIVTNAPDEMIPVFGLDQVPYPVFSLQKNPAKTDPKYFHTLLEEQSLDVDNVVYFEHSPEAVESAVTVGIATHWYNHTQPDLEALKVFLDTHLSQ